MVASRDESMAMFTCLMSHIFSANEQCFSLITNQRKVFFSLTYQPSEQVAPVDPTTGKSTDRLVQNLTMI